MQGGRPKSREIVFRTVFETEVSGEDPLEALELALGRYRLTPDGRDHALRLCGLLIARRAECERLIREQLRNWEFERLSTVVRVVLVLATAELLGAPDVPGAVILDQAVELGKRYGEEGAEGFINGVLDPVLLRIRPEEAAGRKAVGPGNEGPQGGGGNRAPGEAQG